MFDLSLRGAPQDTGSNRRSRIIAPTAVSSLASASATVDADGVQAFAYGEAW